MKNSFTAFLFGTRDKLIVSQQDNLVRSGHWVLQIHNFIAKHHSDTHLDTHIVLSCNRVTSFLVEDQTRKIQETPLLICALYKSRNEFKRYLSFPNHSPKQFVLDSLTFPIQFNVSEYFPLPASTEFGIHFSLVRVDM